MTAKSELVLLPRPLAEEISCLNERQRRAVLTKSHTVVLAGPGAGKTRMLVAKAAYLAFAQVQAPQRVACVTFGTQAAEEIRRRLRSLHPAAGGTVTCATVHAFCLAEVLTPFANVAGYPPIAAQSVISKSQEWDLRVRAYDEARLGQDPTWTESRDIACRRALFSGEPVTRFDPQVVTAARTYDRLLADAGMLDFEAMVGRSLQILRDRPVIRQMVAARFPWLVVDEYQDLGPVLHGIVVCLRDAGVRIFAVGDPDQCIHGFTGSDPRHLIELADDPQFHVERLRINYRAGHVLVGAAATVLGQDRGYVPHNQAKPGVLDHRPVAGAVTAHAGHTARLITDLLSRGVAAHEIAVLYPRNRKKTPLRDWLAAALQAADVPLLVEKREQPWPQGRIVRFLQKAASWQLGRRLGRSHPAATRFDELADEYAALRATSWHQVSERLAARTALWEALAATGEPEEPLPVWLERLDNTLGLTRLLRRGFEAQELAAMIELLGTRWSTATIAEFAGDIEAVGKVSLTTYHSAKGREWQYVLLPALQEGVVPGWPLDYGRPYSPSATMVEEERRTFYVALTRAQQAALLIYTPDGRPSTAAPSFLSSPSRFIANLPGFQRGIPGSLRT